MKNTCEGKPLRLNRELYQKKGQPFSITLCTHNKIPLLNEFGELIFQSIMEGTLRKASDLMAVCAMPDHIHFLLAPISKNIVDLIGNWKGYATHLICKEGYKGKVWQRSFYDHALRKEEDIVKAANYIVFNPVRKEWYRIGKPTLILGTNGFAMGGHRGPPLRIIILSVRYPSR